MSRYSGQMPNEAVISPVWLFRVLPAVITVLVALSMLVLKGAPHDFCLGLALGLLVGLTVSCWQLQWRRDDDTESSRLTQTANAE